MKVIDVRLQVADIFNRLAGCGYDGRVVRVEGEIDMVRGWGIMLTYRMKRTGEINPPELTQPACLDGMIWASERMLRTPIPEVG